MLSNTDKPTNKNEVLAVPAPQVRQSLNSGSLGTESSNTVPPTCNTDTIILRTGIDSLYLTYRGELRESSNARLIKCKQLAQSEVPSKASLAQYEIDDHIFEVYGNGRNPYAFILADSNYRIEIAKLGAKLIPMAYCKISSETLTILGADRAVQELTALVSKLGSLDGPPSVSRADICTDFVTQADLSAISEKDFVTKARSFDRHTVRRQFSGFSFSARAPLSARLYNKSLEMQCNYQRPYLEKLWFDAGWNGSLNVWRMEFQFRRAALRQLSIVTYKDLALSLSGLWAHSTNDWLKHTVPSISDKTQTRWPCSNFWREMQQAPWESATEQKLTRVNLERGRVPSDNYLFINGISPLTSFCAREGIERADDGAIAFVAAARHFHNARSVDTGVDFVNYFTQKIEDKRKAYNVALNSPLDGGIHPADKAVTNSLRAAAREYRKAKDGE
jgi:hypothetical protein